MGIKKMSDFNCPNCGTKIERKYGLPAIAYDCPGCKKQWIKCLGKLVSREEFIKEKVEFNS